VRPWGEEFRPWQIKVREVELRSSPCNAPFCSENDKNAKYYLQKNVYLENISTILYYFATILSSVFNIF
jgi:hypothetical protein